MLKPCAVDGDVCGVSIGDGGVMLLCGDAGAARLMRWLSKQHKQSFRENPTIERRMECLRLYVAVALRLCSFSRACVGSALPWSPFGIPAVATVMRAMAVCRVQRA